MRTDGIPRELGKELASVLCSAACFLCNLIFLPSGKTRNRSVSHTLTGLKLLGKRLEMRGFCFVCVCVLVSGVAVEPGSVDGLGLAVAGEPWARGGCRWL